MLSMSSQNLKDTVTIARPATERLRRTLEAKVLALMPSSVKLQWKIERLKTSANVPCNITPLLYKIQCARVAYVKV